MHLHALPVTADFHPILPEIFWPPVFATLLHFPDSNIRHSLSAASSRTHRIKQAAQEGVDGGKVRRRLRQPVRPRH